MTNKKSDPNDWSEDVRRPGESRRRGNFKAGFHDAISGKDYTEEALTRLTWQNLGWRLGRAIDQELEEDALERLFELHEALRDSDG